jgi:putative transposase
LAALRDLTDDHRRTRRVARLRRRPELDGASRPLHSAPGHKIFPYLLRRLTIERPNQVWAAEKPGGQRWRSDVD